MFRLAAVWATTAIPLIWIVMLGSLGAVSTETTAVLDVARPFILIDAHTIQTPPPNDDAPKAPLPAGKRLYPDRLFGLTTLTVTPRVENDPLVDDDEKPPKPPTLTIDTPPG